MKEYKHCYRSITALLVLAMLSGCAAQKPYTRGRIGRREGRGISPERARRARSPRRVSVIVIDPGHGGKALGAVGPTGLKEKDVALGIAKKLKRLLERDGYLAFLTRDADYDVPLSKRREIASRHKADLFISIHCDGSEKAKAHGTAVYILSWRGARIIKDRALTKGDYLLPDDRYERTHNDYLHKTIVDLKFDGSARESRVFAERAVSYITEELGTKNMGVKRAAFAVLKNVDVPSCLVEVAFITNWWEEKLLKQDAVRGRVAKALADAIHSYFEEKM